MVFGVVLVIVDFIRRMGIIEMSYEIILGSIIGGVFGLALCKLMFYEGDKLNWLRCKRAL